MISNDPINIDQRDESCLPAQIVQALKIIKFYRKQRQEGGDLLFKVGMCKVHGARTVQVGDLSL